jgi:hypothetical protein
MARFLVTYIGGGMSHDPELMAQAKAAFMAWAEQTGPALIDPGSPLQTVAMIASGTPAEEATVSGYSIIEADDTEAAKALLASHPFIGRGGTLQVSQALAV